METTFRDIAVALIKLVDKNTDTNDDSIFKKYSQIDGDFVGVGAYMLSCTFGISNSSVSTYWSSNKLTLPVMVISRLIFKSFKIKNKVAKNLNKDIEELIEQNKTALRPQLLLKRIKNAEQKFLQIHESVPKWKEVMQEICR